MYEDLINALRFHGSALSLEAADAIEELEKGKNRKRRCKIEDDPVVTVTHIPFELTQECINQIADAVIFKMNERFKRNDL